MANSALLRLPSFLHKPRVFILSDIENEPDDQQSLVRYLLYANEFDTRGICAVTSAWLPTRTAPEAMMKIVRAYGNVVANLNHHVHPEAQYPPSEALEKLISSGWPIYGMAALQEPLSQGAINLIDQLEESEEPLWVISWGGTNVLAEALQHIRKESSPEEQKKLHGRLRVYTISDQDDTGDWIRVTFPDVFYICSIHGFGAFDMSAWQGIAHPIAGGDMSKVSAEWLGKHIQKGLLGEVYPTSMHIMEGDTPTFLYLIQNGLGDPENPSFGSWGGRYRSVTVGSPRYADVIDTIHEADGSERTDNKVTIRRWRDHFQNDFATRMRWTLTSDFESVSHPAVPVVNGHTGPSQLRLNAKAGDAVILDASGSYDPDHPNDNSRLTFRWYQYAEPTLNHPIGVQAVPRCTIKELKSTHTTPRVQTFDTAGFEILAQGPRVEVTVPKSNEPAIFNLPAQHWLPYTGIDGLAYHVILEVVNTDTEFPVRRYLRIILDAGLT